MTTAPGHELQLRIQQLEAQVKQLTAENWRLVDALQVVRTATAVALTQTGAWSPTSPAATVSAKLAAARQLAPQTQQSA